MCAFKYTADLRSSLITVKQRSNCPYCATLAHVLAGVLSFSKNELIYHTYRT